MKKFIFTALLLSTVTAFFQARIEEKKMRKLLNIKGE